MKRLFLVVLTNGCLLIPQLSAQWSDNPLINSPVTTAVGQQTNPVAVSDGSGGIIVAWQDGRRTPSDIYAQRLSANGTALWTTDGVPVCTYDSIQSNPVIVSDGAGGAIVAWVDMRNGNRDIYAQRVNASGVALWTNYGVPVCTATADQLQLVMTTDGAGGAILAWQDDRSGLYYDIYAQRLNASGVPQWTLDGVAVCTAAYDQVIPAIVADGAGGAVVSWQDYRNNADWNIYAQRLSPAGTTEWLSNGVVVTSAANSQTSPIMVSDGAAGAIIAWSDYRSGTNVDIYAQRVSATGSRVWDTTDVAIANLAGTQYMASIAADGAGGAFIAWSDNRSTSYDIYAQRINANGTVHWVDQGIGVCTAAQDQGNPVITADGAGGAILAWLDYRNGVTLQVFAQRMSPDGVPEWAPNGVVVTSAINGKSGTTIVNGLSGGFIVAWSDVRSGNADILAQRLSGNGALGDGTVSIQSVRDVRNDQGGLVNVLWNPSPYDIWPDRAITAYQIFRGINSAAALPVKAPGENPSMTDGRTGAVYSSKSSLTSLAGLYWQQVGTVTARNLSGYAFASPTSSDSSPAGVPYYYFFVRALTSDSTVYWDSPVDSGYSVDNIPPGVVARVGGVFAAGTETLHWDANTDKDLAGYLVYRNTAPSFAINGMMPLSSTTGNSYTDPGAGVGAVLYYTVVAFDIHGNKSSPSPIVSTLSTDVQMAGALPTSFALRENYPNPFNPSTVISYDVPRSSVVRLTVYDIMGREIARLVNGEVGPGEHHVQWNANAMSSGIYYAKMESSGFVAVRKLLLLK